MRSAPRRRWGEFELIGRLARLFGAPPRPALGIGDDAAVFSAPSRRDLVWTTDAAVEDVHFRRSWLTLEEVGLRAATAGMSDLAAMGADPLFALVSLHLPPHMFSDAALAVARGLKRRFRRFGVRVVGGNVTRSSALVLDLSLLGSAPKGRAIRRSGASPGDDLYVTGVPGAAGLAEELLRRGWGRRPIARPIVKRWKEAIPRLDEGRRLRGLATAAIDISDGLLADAGHLAKASGVDLAVEAARLPTPPRFRKAAEALGSPFLRFSSGASDDYELLFTAPRTSRAAVARRFGPLAQRIGRATRPGGRVSLEEDIVTEVNIRKFGWDHGIK